MSNAANRTCLTIRRDEARVQLVERIGATHHIGADDIQSIADLERVGEHETRWRAFNSALLSRLFTTEEFAREYDSSVRPVHLVADRYIDSSLSQIKGRLIDSIKGQINTLQSIVERLVLIDEQVIPTPASETVRETENALTKIIDRFHLVARQIRVRHDSRSTLQVDDEYDVQDLVHALLAIHFDDIRREEWTPSYAGGAARIDFLLPEIQTAIEVKKARPGLTARRLGEELIIDIEKYRHHPECKKLLCFVYDPDGNVANPRGVESDLTKQRHGLTVKVMIVPRLR